MLQQGTLPRATAVYCFIASTLSCACGTRQYGGTGDWGSAAL